MRTTGNRSVLEFGKPTRDMRPSPDAIEEPTARQLLARRWLYWLDQRERRKFSVRKIAQLAGKKVRTVQYGLQQARRLRDDADEIVEAVGASPR